jgi:hypothetical protein
VKNLPEVVATNSLRRYSDQAQVHLSGTDNANLSDSCIILIKLNVTVTIYDARRRLITTTCYKINYWSVVSDVLLATNTDGSHF